MNHTDPEFPGRKTLSRRAPAVLAIALILILYGAAHTVGIATCPLRSAFGLSCPGCGMSRAWCAFLTGDLPGALHIHPLFWLPVPALLLILFRDRIPSRVFLGLAILMLVLYLGVYFIRLADPADEVVWFRPEEGLFYRMFHRLPVSSGK